MNLTLERESFGKGGIFGKLFDEKANEIAVTLEHAYQQPPPYIGYYSAKLPFGIYHCARGLHQLKNMAAPFETFEVTGVPGHKGILFHCGNDNDDSAGCILLGREQSGDWILESRNAFAAFMALQAGADSFTLVVK